MRRPETDLQRSVATYLTTMLKPPPEGPFWTSINPLPSKGKHLGAMRKMLGMKAGVPDILIIWRGRAIFIELKAPGGTVQPNQKQARQDITSAGGIATICYSLQAVIEFLDVMNIPTRAERRAA